MVNPKNLSGGGGVGFEFQSPEDEAWYNVKLVVRGDALIVKFTDISDAFLQTKFSAKDFKSMEELENFIHKRFRPISVQLQDYECNKIVIGMTVSASFHFATNDVLFHDALVEKVDYNDHTFEGGQEVCTCKFLLSWLNGKNHGKKTMATIEDICLIQTGNVRKDPVIDLFVEVSRVKFDATEQDIDLGGKSNLTKDVTEACSCHYLLIENMEKNLSPSTIVDFVKSHLSISSKAQVLPSLSSESYTRGFIAVDSQEELQKLADFLLNPAHIISSSKGRVNHGMKSTKMEKKLKFSA